MSEIDQVSLESRLTRHEAELSSLHAADVALAEMFLSSMRSLRTDMVHEFRQAAAEQSSATRELSTYQKAQNGTVAALAKDFRAHVEDDNSWQLHVGNQLRSIEGQMVTAAARAAGVEEGRKKGEIEGQTVEKEKRAQERALWMAKMGAVVVLVLSALASILKELLL